MSEEQISQYNTTIQALESQIDGGRNVEQMGVHRAKLASFKPYPGQEQTLKMMEGTIDTMKSGALQP